MPKLDAKPDLKALQKYVTELEQERGFTENTL